MLDTAIVKVVAAGGSVASTGAAFAIGEASVAMFGLPLQSVLAGFGGALFGLSVFPVATISRAVGAVIGNTLAAGYTTKLALHVTGVPDGLQLGIAFIIGAVAQILLSIFVDWARKRFGGGP